MRENNQIPEVVDNSSSFGNLVSTNALPGSAVYDAQKSRTETVESNNSSQNIGKTQILSVSSATKNGHSNTICPIGSSSNGHRTETVQSSILEKDQNNYKNAKKGTDLAKQLTEGKINYAQFVSQFQAMIP